MIVKKRLILSFCFLILVISTLALNAETGRLEIVELGEGVRAHKQVRKSMEDNHIKPEDVIEAYKTAIVKRKKEETVIFEEREDFVIFISMRDKMIVSIIINKPVHMQEEL